MRFIVRYLGDLRDRPGLTGIWIFVDWIKTILGLMESLDYVFRFVFSNTAIYFLS